MRAMSAGEPHRIILCPVGSNSLLHAVKILWAKTILPHPNTTVLLFGAGNGTRHSCTTPD